MLQGIPATCAMLKSRTGIDCMMDERRRVIYVTIIRNHQIHAPLGREGILVEGLVFLWDGFVALFSACSNS